MGKESLFRQIKDCDKDFYDDLIMEVGRAVFSFDDWEAFNPVLDSHVRARYNLDLRFHKNIDAVVGAVLAVVNKHMVVAACTYCGNRYGYGADPDGVCPVCERNYKREEEKCSTKR